MQKIFLGYLNSQLHSKQWSFFLEALSQEFLHQLPSQDMRGLARNAGMRAARNMPLPECDSLQKMGLEANAQWSRLGWGFVSFEEKNGQLIIQHHLSPLKATVGKEALCWSAGFLEGVYQEWFVLLGAGSELQVIQVGEDDECGGLTYRLGR